MTGRRIATLYLPMDVRTFVEIAEAIDHRYPGALLATEPGDPATIHCEEGPRSRVESDPDRREPRL